MAAWPEPFRATVAHLRLRLSRAPRRPWRLRKRGECATLRTVMPYAPEGVASQKLMLRDARRSAVLNEARCEEIARLIIMGGTVKSWAERLGVSRRTLNDFISTPEFVRFYREYQDKFYENVDLILKDEKVAPAVRHAALQTRSMTLLGEVMEQAHQHFERAQAGGIVRAGFLKAAVDAAAEVRQLGGALGTLNPQGGAQSGPTSVTTVNINADRLAFIKGTLAESGVDLSDVLKPHDPTAVDAESEAVEAEAAVATESQETAP